MSEGRTKKTGKLLITLLLYAEAQGLNASLRWDPIRRPHCRSRTRLRASQAFRLLGPQPRMGSPIVVPNSIALGRLSKPSGAQPSNPWTVTSSMPFILFIRKEGLFAEPSSASLGHWVSPRLQEEPPSLYMERGRSGGPLAFCATLAHPFRLEGGGGICQATLGGRER